MVTALDIKKKALELGADLVGIGDICLFEGTTPQHDPKMILPKATCVIGCAFRVPRALYQAMHDQVQYLNYAQLGVRLIDEEVSEIFLLRLGAMIEDAGYDACVQRNVSNLMVKGDKSTNPEVYDTYELKYAEAVAPGKPAPDVILDVAQAARICGLGSLGDSGHVLARELGPYVRFVFIITDMPLECDPPFEGTLCDHCGKCAASCPGHAISKEGLDTWQCAVYYKGAHKNNPFMHDGFLKGSAEREKILSGEKRFDSESARALYPQESFLPTEPMRGYMPALCGKACDYACYHHLKETGRL